jgi:membrane protein YqaA with SNARE-associated domain
MHKIRDASYRERKAGWRMVALFLAATLDASFLPFPVTTMFVILTLSRPSNTATFAVIAVLGTLTGAAAGYLAGRYLWIDNTGDFSRFAAFCFRSIPGFSAESYEKLSELYSEWNIGLILFASFTAMPFGVMSVSAGLFSLHPVVFLMTSLIGQTAKYGLLSFLCRRYGYHVIRILKFNWKPWLISAALLFASFAFILKIANH